VRLHSSLLLIGACLACSTEAPRRSGVAATEGAVTDGAAEDTVTVLYISTPERMWHPSMSVSTHHLLFLRLFRWDENGQPEGELVREWESSEDGRTWTYHLRTDVRWHDGVPFTAYDIEFTHDLLGNREAEFPWDITGSDVTVIDDSTLTIRYDRRGWPDPLETWLVYYPKHLLQDLDPAENYEWDFWRQPIGNGPYRYVRHAPLTMVELERNPDYYGPAPEIERIILRFGSANGRIELQAGNADVAGILYLPVRDAFRLADIDEQFRAYYAPDSRSYVLFWNHRNPLFADRRVRQALTHALDREAFAAIVDLPRDLPLVDVPTASSSARDHLDPPPPTPFDPRLADSLLVAAGWIDEDGDGVREQTGRRFAFSVLVNAETSRLAVLLQSQFRDIGAEVTIETLGGGIRQRVEEGDFETTIAVGRDMYMLGQIREEATGAQARPTSFTGYDGAEIGALAAALDTAFVPESRERLYRAIWRIWQEDLPATYLVNRVLVSVAHRRIRGLSSPHRAFAASHMHELWIEDEEEDQ
jgi:peptide/nickel transport system substrate-binding protein